MATQWITVGPMGCMIASGGGRGRAAALRTSSVGRLRFHLRLAMVVPGEWWASNAASWMRAKTAWTMRAAAKWEALEATKAWQGLLLVAKVEQATSADALPSRSLSETPATAAWAAVRWVFSPISPGRGGGATSTGPHCRCPAKLPVAAPQRTVPYTR